jgi:hypothetical protein
MINQTLINSTVDLMWSINKDYKIIALNDAFRNCMKFYSGLDFNIADSILIQGLFEENHPSEWKKWYDKAFQGENVREEITSPKTDSHETQWFEISIHPMLENNVIIGAACFGKNITTQKSAIDSLSENEKRYRGILNNLKAGKLDLNVEEVNIIKLTHQVIELFKHEAQQKNISLDLSIDPDVPVFIFVDAIRLKQTLVNLISNALKFTSFGRIHLDIHCIANSKGTAMLQFSVKDTVVGIKDFRKNIPIFCSRRLHHN